MTARLLRYPPFDTPGRQLPRHIKYECKECNHVSAEWFPDTDKLGVLYEDCYPSKSDSPNPRIHSEVEIINRIVNRLGDGVNVLDFSCGDNYPILQKDLDVSLRACDVRTGYPYDGDRFFKFNPDSEPEQTFQAIFSVDALEHVSELESTWRYFNRALTMGGLMAHSFPTATAYPKGHHFYQIPFHANLFSEESLDRWAEKMGFAYTGSDPLPSSDVGSVHWFKKVGEIK
ncbi:methyltransferase domain-containing protein [Halolamina sediminis]|uniref:methyltransferase domain-containing protein n=1 Tax=Halolamina sediminis TaxID=1480675 RepID=UPI00137921BC|nr:methyltransferase domain-containing protein [Halolamina sediminis]